MPGELKVSQSRHEPTAPTRVPPGIEYSVVNENWRGKNDPTERRRIQNRLNQRAFRERRRAGQPAKQYRPRASSAATSQERASGDEEDNDDDDDDEEEEEEEEEDDDDDDNDIDSNADTDGSDSDSEADDCRSHAATPERGSSSTTTPSPMGNAVDAAGRVWDELARLIRRNLMVAAVANAQHLGIPPAAIQRATPAYTPRLSNPSVSAGLVPVNLQYTVAHDLIVDTIPHPRFRSNILRGVAARAFDANLLYDTIRSSGALEPNRASGDGWQRGGLVVWSTLPPDQITSWEMSEAFIRRWAILLQGCDDLLAVTNAWRAKRGESTLVLAVRSG